LRDFKVPKSEIEERISNLQNEISDSNLDGALILYNGYLADCTRTFVMGKLENIVQYRSYKGIQKILKDYDFNAIKKIGLELDVMPVFIFNRISKALKEIEFHDISNSIKNVRMVKSNWELALIKGAGDVLVKAIGSVPEIIKEGMSEIELSAEIERIMRINGHQGVVRMRRWNQESFFGLVLSGESGSVSNYMDAPLGGLGPNPAAPRGASFKIIKKNEPIIVDIVGGYNGYLADCTRTFVMGKLENGIAQESGFADNFMGAPGSNVIFIAHGIGLELDEPPVIAKYHDFTLKRSTALAIEPKMVFPGKGAVGIESTWACGEGKSKNLTQLPEAIIEC
jgi:Xaa-Pro dipeptidase